ncbi:PAS domain-containing sensor histidine kinase [Pseudorhodoferax sp.]|uniref:PAS domain-containing sensor histidine kinase n=1 Tax=Pseudorhodoferax sp. TaxID=1993553 RepID=UPI002DD666C2|nr:ATP-binding protein [Pseudorhodoferax sp.]
MPTSQLSSSLQSSSGTTAWLVLLCLALAVALVLAATAWWRQRGALQAAHGQNQQLRGELQPLQQRAELCNSLLSGIPGAAYRCTADGRWTVQFISEAVTQLSGWSQADYLASPTLLREMLHPDEQQRVSREIQAAVDESRNYTLEYRAVHRDGRVFWVWEQGKAVRDAAGRVLWLDGVMIDISERKAMELALRDAKNRAEEAAASKTAFLSNMGHEVRTPLNAIIGFSEIVLRNELDTLQRQYVYKVRQAATALLRLMNDILDMAKLERSQLQCASGAFSLRQVAQEALALQREAADRKGLALRLDCEPGLADDFQGDAARLGQVLDKLLDNAVKFTERGSVRLQLARQQGQVLLAVHDTGIGIAPNDQERIFEAFAQADGSASRRFGGTGLGLTLAHQLVERMGGSLALQSAPGQGSVFRVLLPLVDIAAPQAAHSAEAVQAPHADAPLPAGLQALLDAAPAPAEQPWRDSLRATVVALRNGDHGDAALPALLQSLRGHGLAQHVVQVEHALAQFDLDRAAELLETLPARL